MLSLDLIQIRGHQAGSSPSQTRYAPSFVSRVDSNVCTGTGKNVRLNVVNLGFKKSERTLEKLPEGTFQQGTRMSFLSFPFLYLLFFSRFFFSIDLRLLCVCGVIDTTCKIYEYVVVLGGKR